MEAQGRTRHSSAEQREFGGIHTRRNGARVSLTMLAAVVLVWAAPCCTGLWAAPTTARDAEMVVEGWLSLDPLPLETALGRDVLSVDTFADDLGQPMYYVVNLAPSGFVVVSADDLVEPIIGFAADGVYDPAPESPLGALIAQDLDLRLGAAREGALRQGSFDMQAVAPARLKWADLLFLSYVSLETIDELGGSEPSDVRVAPLVQTRWGQRNVRRTYTTDPTLPCYNYYTPQWSPLGYIQWQANNTNNYLSGCVATAMAQLMRYHQYPLLGVGAATCTIWVKSDAAGSKVETQCRVRGGDGVGGPYLWANMVAVPDPTTPDSARRAIGALMHDAGLSVGMSYGSAGSGADTLDAANALKNTFLYGNAVAGDNNGNNIGAGLEAMINPNLDARHPVILGISGPDGGHAILADGYGYDAAGTAYHHLNMGWSGVDDCWYNLPEIKCTTNQFNFGVVRKCVYNIFRPAEDGRTVTGEILSGRVVDSEGYPIAGVVVTAAGTRWDPRGFAIHEPERLTTTNDKGIYAFAGLTPTAVYTIEAAKSPYVFSAPQFCAMGESRDHRPTSGNRWGVDFVGYRQNLSVAEEAVDGDINATTANAAQGRW